MSASLESLMRQSAIEAPRISVLAQLASFLIVGGTAAGSFVLLSSAMLGLRTGIPDWIVSSLCYAAFIVPVYLAHRQFSFNSRAQHRRALPRYVAVQLSGLTLAAIFSFVAYGVFRLPPVMASMLVIGLTSGVNFTVLRLWAFSGGK